MTTDCKSNKAIILIGLVVFLLSFSVAQAQVQTSYIIVHALNPEGVEIASIEGVNPYSVPIYNGDTLIGFSAYNTDSYNQPIPILSGTHAIKAVFNSVVKEQTVNLNPGEIKQITFTFGRTEFDLAGYFDSIGGSQ